MNKSYIAAAIVGFGLLYSGTSSAAVYEAVFKGYEFLNGEKVDAEADFYYELSYGSIVNTSTSSTFTGQLLEESASIYVGTIGTYTFGSEDKFVGEYYEDTQDNFSVAAFTISGLGGTLNAEFIANGATTIPANITSGIALSNSGYTESNYTVTDGPSGSFVATSVNVIAPSPVPIPKSAPLFATALLALAGIGLRRRVRGGVPL